MRLVSPASAFFALGSLAWSCAVYDKDLISSGLSGGGEAPNAGRVSSAGTDSAGQAMTGGTHQGGDTALGGTGGLPPEAGAPSDGGDSPLMTGGTGGGGVGGSGTTGGGGGKAGAGGASGSSGNGGGGTGGSGGSGGSAPVAKCADHPIPLKTSWVPSASSSSFGSGVETDGLYNPPEHLTDGLYNERWSSGKTQAGDEWIQIDFGAVVNITTLTLNVNNDTGDYPRSYAVRISSKSQDFAAPVKASGDGMPGNTVVLFPGIISGRYLTVRQTGVNTVDSAWWTIAEVLVGCTDP